ncbi:MAG: hypothetical protein V1778_02375 [bacterium]
MATPTERSILSTLAYYDGFSYPLTLLEVWKWLIAEPSDPSVTLGDVERLLRESIFLNERIEEREGMFFLRGRDELLAIRKERYLLAERKFQRLHRAMRVLRLCPFIRTVAVCNSLAYANACDESDLDIFLLVEHDHIWTARMFATGLATILRWRPEQRGLRDSVCLSFYLSDISQPIDDLMTSNDDTYLRYWIDHLVLIYGDMKLLDTFRSANRWTRDRLPNTHGTAPAWRRMTQDTWLSNVIKQTIEKFHTGRFGETLERRYRDWQMRHLPQQLQALVNKDSRVIMNDRMLKFHENDRRTDFISHHAARLKEVLGT